MALIVHKYGGSSMGTPERIRGVAQRVKRWRDQGHQVVVVVAAMSGETNRLLALAQEVSVEPNPRELDVMVSTGEQVSMALLAIALQDIGVPARSYTGAQARVLTDNVYTQARILSIDESRIRGDLDLGRVVIVAGFQGVDEEGNITTLGRGGSDTTAVALASALQAEECRIYADVDGVYSADPHIEPEARRLERLTFEEMLEMASMGSRIVQLRAVEFAGKYKVRLRVLSGCAEEGEETTGTLITDEEDRTMEQPIISSIACNRDEAKLTVLGVPDRPGIASQILGPIAEANVDVDMIIQNIGHDGLTDFSFTVNRDEYPRALKILEEQVKPHIGARAIEGDNRICKVSAVGVGMRSHPGVASRMFRILAEEGINIRMISTSEIKISVVVDEKYMELAVRVLHQAFGLENPPV